MAVTTPKKAQIPRSPAGGSTRSRLWRYNYAIITGIGYWILVLPVAASQMVTLWMMALAGDFNQDAATRISEMMTPILGAFLVAHAMAPEYRSGIGSVLACKPVSLHRVVTMRVGLALLMPVLLTFVTLGVCHIGMKPIDLGDALLAGLPPLWFLSMLALTFATLFRSSLAGFAVAAGLWALDLALGFPIHPFLSLQARSAALGSEPLAEHWVWNKLGLLALGTLLLFIHGRLIPRICRPAEGKDIARMGTAVGLVLLAYCGSGAAATVSYAHANRGHLRQPDDVWLRRQFKAYGPIPVVRLFGPAFADYVIEPKPGRSDVSLADLRVQQLERAMERSKNSIWADSIAFTWASQLELRTPAKAAAAYFQVAQRFPTSPFAPLALARIVRNSANVNSPEDQLKAARQLLQQYPKTPDAERAAGYLLTRHPDMVDAKEMLAAAKIAVEAGPRFMQAPWLLTQARMSLELDNPTDAKQQAQAAKENGKALLAEMQGNPDLKRELDVRRPILDGTIRDADELLAKLGGK